MAKITLRPGAKKSGSKSPTSASRKALAKKGAALPDGSFPTPNADFLDRAVRSIGRAPASKRPRLKRYLRKRARALGRTDLLKSGALALSREDIDALELAVVTPPHLVPGARAKLTSKGGIPSVKVAAGDTPGKRDADGDFDGDKPSDVAAKKRLGLKNKQALDVYRKAIKRGLSPKAALVAAKTVDKRLGDPRARSAREMANDPKG